MSRLKELIASLKDRFVDEKIFTRYTLLMTTWFMKRDYIKVSKILCEMERMNSLMAISADEGVVAWIKKSDTLDSHRFKELMLFMSKKYLKPLFLWIMLLNIFLRLQLDMGQLNLYLIFNVPNSLVLTQFRADFDNLKLFIASFASKS